VRPPRGRPEEGSPPLGGTARSAKGAPVTEAQLISSRDNPLLVRLRKLLRDPAGYRKAGEPDKAKKVEEKINAKR